MRGALRARCAVSFHTPRRRKMGLPSSRRVGATLLAFALAATVAACGSDDSGSSSSSSGGGGSANKKFTLGVSNTLVGNGWREEMICAVKAQALASGAVDKVIVADRNGGAAGQGGGPRHPISGGGGAVVVQPPSPPPPHPVSATPPPRGRQ